MIYIALLRMNLNSKFPANIFLNNGDMYKVKVCHDNVNTNADASTDDTMGYENTAPFHLNQPSYISMGECNTVLSTYTLYRHLG